jgi:hypothetical protein
MDDNRCCECQKTMDEARLHKCPVCFKYSCDEHAASLSGRMFCSKGCADYFFFADEGDDE